MINVTINNQVKSLPLLMIGDSGIVYLVTGTYHKDGERVYDGFMIATPRETDVGKHLVGLHGLTEYHGEITLGNY